MRHTLSILFFIMLLAGLSCKKDTTVDYSVRGKITDADEGNSLEGVSVSVEKQSVQNGVYGNTYQNAFTTASASDGSYSGSWPRENFAALRLLARKSGYIQAEIPLNVDEFERNRSITQDVQLYKEAFTTFRFTHSDGVDSDRISFTFLNANFNCNCCSNGWKTWQAANLDTAFTCRIYGNRWLKYQVLTQVGFIDSSYVDSIYCPAFVTTSHDIHY